MTLSMTARQMAHMVAHARAGAPEEVCGLVLGRDGVAGAVYRVPNVARTPHVTYLMQPETQVLLFDYMDRRGWDVLGIYHSHPRGPELPSATDIAQSYYPDTMYVIVSLAAEPPSVRAFRIADNRVDEGQLRIVG